MTRVHPIAALAALLAAAGCVAEPNYAPPVVAQPIMLTPPPLPNAAAVAEPALTPFQPMPLSEAPKPVAASSSSKPTATEASVVSTQPSARARPVLPRSAVPLAGFRPLRAAPKPTEGGI